VVGVALLTLWLVGLRYGNVVFAPWLGHWGVWLIDGRVNVVWSDWLKLFAGCNSRGEPGIGCSFPYTSVTFLDGFLPRGKASTLACWHRKDPLVKWEHTRDDLMPPSLKSVSLPLWWVAVPMGGIALGSEYRRKRRGKSGACRACGYSRVGITAETVCPECGVKGER
jgi:hypothetical protein